MDFGSEMLTPFMLENLILDFRIRATQETNKFASRLGSSLRVNYHSNYSDWLIATQPEPYPGYRKCVEHWKKELKNRSKC